MVDNAFVEKLIDVLDKEAAVYEDILKISKNKTGIIVKGRVSDLENLVKLEQALVVQMGKLEGMREDLVEKISAQLSVDPETITISQLAGLIMKEEAEKLGGRHKKLAGVLSELKDANDLNSKLIKNSLDYIDFSINVMTSASMAGSNNYGNSGVVEDGGNRSLFDVKL